jgi:hypothetical protein
MSNGIGWPVERLNKKSFSVDWKAQPDAVIEAVNELLKPYKLKFVQEEDTHFTDSYAFRLCETGKK